MTKEEKQKAFDEFWKQHWPKCRRKDKKKTLDQWMKISPELHSLIFAALTRQKKQPAWNKSNGEFIPYPHRWLRDRRWEDEITLPEDADAEVLITALQNNSSVPPDFPKHIMDRFRKMCARLRTNWPELHLFVARMEEEAHDHVRDEYLKTE